MAVNKGIFNNYTVLPRNLTQYTAYRGVTDFSQIGQFNQFESGYQFLSVIAMPKFIEKLGDQDTEFKKIKDSFKHMLEMEFRGLDGLPDLTGDTFEITDGINTQRMINKVTKETSVTVSMSYFEKAGGLITKFSEYYLTGIKDPATQAKTYHGLIPSNDMAPGLENEVFTMMYYVTDNTMLRLERAVLLANCQLTKAETSMYNGSRDNISNKEMSIEFNCFPITGYSVDKAANYLLSDITGYKNQTNNNVHTFNKRNDVANPTVLDSNDYKYGIMYKNGDKNPEAIDVLTKAYENG